MYRHFSTYLLDWKKREHKKPLIIRGARQVGKTFAVEEFGKSNFKQFFKINFEETPELKNFFATNDVKETLQNLEMFFDTEINLKETLLFLDEIQVCPEAIISLRYFYEKIPQLHIIAAGSLLDHTLSDLKFSMPVGRVEFAYMYPMDFYEFLLANNEKKLVNFLKKYTFDKKINTVFHQKLLKYLRLYFFIGGMPEAVKVFVERSKLVDVERVHESILKSYEYDFAKYGTGTQQEIMSRLLHFVPKNICQKFKYVNFDNSIRSNITKEALNLLQKSRIISPITYTKASGVPLSQNINERIFKLLFLDIGLVNHSLKIRLKNIEDLLTINEGALAEQFVGQEFISFEPYFLENNLFYWIREKQNAEAELDYLAEVDDKVVPIEVKAGKTGSLKSLQVYVAEKNVKTAIRFNTDLPTVADVKIKISLNKQLKDVDFKLISLPFYLIKEFKRLFYEVAES